MGIGIIHVWCWALLVSVSVTGVNIGIPLISLTQFSGIKQCNENKRPRPNPSLVRTLKLCFLSRSKCRSLCPTLCSLSLIRGLSLNALHAAPLTAGTTASLYRAMLEFLGRLLLLCYLFLFRYGSPKTSSLCSVWFPNFSALTYIISPNFAALILSSHIWILNWILSISIVTYFVYLSRYHWDTLCLLLFFYSFLYTFLWSKGGLQWQDVGYINFRGISRSSCAFPSWKLLRKC